MNRLNDLHLHDDLLPEEIHERMRIRSKDRVPPDGVCTNTGTPTRPLTLADIQQILAKLRSACVAPPRDFLVTTEAHWERIKASFPARKIEVGEQPTRCFGLPVLVEADDVLAKARALHLCLEGKRVLLVRERGCEELDPRPGEGS